MYFFTSSGLEIPKNFQVLMEINPKADDSMKEKSKPISSEIKTFFFQLYIISFIRLNFNTAAENPKSIFF